MQNDMLKNNIAPWQEKGRWYHAKIDCANQSFITEFTDQFIIDNFIFDQASTITYIAPKPALSEIRIIDIKRKYKDLALPSNASIQMGNMYFRTNGVIQLVAYPTAATAGTCDIWLFIDIDPDTV